MAELDWERITRAALHPTQQALMDLLAGGRIAAPVDLEAELGEPLGAINYHMRRLASRGWVRLVRTEPRRGATKRSTPVPTSQLSRATRRASRS